MKWNDWQAAGFPIAAIARDTDLEPLNVRPSANGQHPTVVDLLRPQGALVVCVKCGQSWPEGAASLPKCDDG